MAQSEALMVNVNAAKGLYDVMKTNLGPKGTIKMLVGGAGGQDPGFLQETDKSECRYQVDKGWECVVEGDANTESNSNHDCTDSSGSR